MTAKNSRNTFDQLAKYCRGMEICIKDGNVANATRYWDAANTITSGDHMSAYEDAIAACFDEYDRFKYQDEYMLEYSEEWSYDRWRIENIQRDKFACATRAQQELVRHIFGVDEETIHEDLVLWRRYIDLHHEVAGMRFRVSA